MSRLRSAPCWANRAFVLSLVLVGTGVSSVRAADTSWPTPLYVGIVTASEGEVPPALPAKTANELAALLVSTGTWRVRGPEEVAERIGGDGGELVERCGFDGSCWNTVGWRLGVDVIVVMELAAPGDGSMPVARATAWGGGQPLGEEPVVLQLPRGGGAPLEWLERTLLASGSLEVRVGPEGQLTLDGKPWRPQTERTPLRPGRHEVRVSYGEEVQVQVVPIFPGQDSLVEMLPPPEVEGRSGGHRRWGLVAAPALAAGGVVALAVQRDRPGDAVR